MAPATATRDGRFGAGRRRQEFVADLEEVSRQIQDPVAKLRFIRTSLSRYEPVDRAVGALPWRPLRRRIHGWMTQKSLADATEINSLGIRVPVDRRARNLRRVRRAAVTAGVATLVAGGVTGAFRASMPAAAEAHRSEAPPPLAKVAEDLPLLPAAIAPSDIWLVEKGADWELYSNGLRIDTSYAAAGEPRRFKVFEEGAGIGREVHTEPVGILFHTSESDIWPLEASFNQNLRDSTQRLLRYLKRNLVYHYLIDRFGRVFRVVEEGSKANHAGNSIWSSGKRIYLNLNNAFLGVSFETRWEGGRALPITQAQLAAGRSLTDYLRQRFDIEGAMCVGHGLTSVNPEKHLIGHHLDWARGFPFKAFGLPDQYARPPASVSLFGFGYDDEFLGVLGEPWPGVRTAERGLAEEAQRTGRTEEALRRRQRALYDEWRSVQARDEETRVSVRAEAAARGPRPTGSGG
jgi:hypothetical protein